MIEKKIKHYTDLKAWQINYTLVLEIYRITKFFPDSEKFGLTSQIRRAAVSVVLNIAEGFGRFYAGDRKRFYFIARGSSAEVENLLFLARDLNYINQIEYRKIKEISFQGYIAISNLLKTQGSPSRMSESE